MTPASPASLLSPPPQAVLTNAFGLPFDNAVATARTCYAPRIVTTADVSKDERAREVRDRIARETYQAGHHTTLQHASFQFALERVSRQLLWSFLHAHPFYNSEQVSQRYVEVKPGNALVPALPPRELALYRETLDQQQAAYHVLCELLLEPVGAEYFRLFPGRRGARDRWLPNVKKKAQEIARYVLPVATHAHLYHTISGLTLHRYHRLSRSLEAPVELGLLVEAMVAAVNAHDPLFFRDIEDPLPLEATPEAQLLEELGCGAGVGGRRARAFNDAFDESLQGRLSKLVDYKVHAEAVLAEAVRVTVGLTPRELSDAEAIRRVLSPAENRLFAESLTLTTLSKSARALSHPHYTFRKKLSHTADSQDQRHRMVPGSRPVLAAQYAGGEPDAVLPELIARQPAAREVYDRSLAQTFRAIDALLDAGVAAADALYLLPNAFPVRFEESGDLLHLHHKWTSRLCYTAQEEIWRASLEEVKQVREVHPRIGEQIMPPCTLRHEAGVRPTCPEGPRYCGVPVWRLELERYQRLI
ncbi:MAG TPA: FAD-dependent thymidylate synthase [Myxococcales bacterium]|nr:FAD-dependent thymidylate synthase [Myxococcales bacterium]